jgi:hypothetical protein
MPGRFHEDSGIWIRAGSQEGGDPAGPIIEALAG